MTILLLCVEREEKSKTMLTFRSFIFKLLGLTTVFLFCLVQNATFTQKKETLEILVPWNRNREIGKPVWSINMQDTELLYRRWEIQRSVLFYFVPTLLRINPGSKRILTWRTKRKTFVMMVINVYNLDTVRSSCLLIYLPCKNLYRFSFHSKRFIVSQR